MTVLLILVFGKVISRGYRAETHMMSWRSDRSRCGDGSAEAHGRHLDTRRPTESSVSRSGRGGILGRGGYPGHGRIHPLRRWLPHRGRRRDLLSAIAAAIKTGWVLWRCRWLVTSRMLWRRRRCHWLITSRMLRRCHWLVTRRMPRCHWLVRRTSCGGPTLRVTLGRWRSLLIRHRRR